MVLLGIVKSYRVKSYRILDKPSGDQLDTYFGQKSENKMIEHPKSFSVFTLQLHKLFIWRTAKSARGVRGSKQEVGWMTALILNGCNRKSYGIGHLAAPRCFVGSHSRVAKSVYLPLYIRLCNSHQRKDEQERLESQSGCL